MSAADAYLQLTGIRYRCVPLYLFHEEFDPLTRLFLRLLKHEQNITRLVNAFGVHRRVVEDVLAELVRRNRASLVIQGDHYNIELLPETSATPRFEAGPAMDVWQDTATGVVLPALIVDPFQRQPSPAAANVYALEDGLELVEPFPEAPDSQLIDMLVRSAPDLNLREEGGMTLDRLTQRFRVQPQTLWLDLGRSEIQGSTILHIIASGIPDWVARMWTVALRRVATATAPAEIRLQVELAWQDRGRMVRDWLLRSHLEQWRDAVERFLHLIPPPRSGYDLRQVRERQTSLTARLLALVKVELVEAPTKQSAVPWFDLVVEGSAEWLVLALPRKVQLESTLEWLRGPHDRALPSTILFVVPPDLADTPGLEALQRAVDVTCDVRWVVREVPTNGPAIAVGNGVRVCLQWQPSGAVLQFGEGNASADWLAIIKEFPQSAKGPNGAERVLRHLRPRRRSVLQDETAKLGLGPDAYTAGAAVDALAGFQEKLLTAMIDPEFLVSQLDREAEQPELVEREITDRKPPLAQQVPILGEECDRLFHELAFPPVAPWAFVMRLSAYDLIPALTDVLSEPERRAVEGEIHILATHIAEQVLNEGFLTLLRTAVLTKGWTVTIGLPGKRDKAPDLERILATLREKVASPRLSLRMLNAAPPLPALIIGDLVFLSSSSWVSEVLTPVIDTSQFGMAIESRELAETLRACLLAAEDYQGGGHAS